MTRNHGNTEREHEFQDARRKFYINKIFVFPLKRSLKDGAKKKKQVCNDTDIK